MVLMSANLNARCTIASLCSLENVMCHVHFGKKMCARKFYANVHMWLLNNILHVHISYHLQEHFIVQISVVLLLTFCLDDNLYI